MSKNAVSPLYIHIRWITEELDNAKIIHVFNQFEKEGHVELHLSVTSWNNVFFPLAIKIVPLEVLIWFSFLGSANFSA